MFGDSVSAPSRAYQQKGDLSQECPLHRRDARSFMMGMGRAGVHRRGDSCSSLRSEDGREGEMSDPGPRPVFFLHGVGLGMVSLSAQTHTFDMQAVGNVAHFCLFLLQGHYLEEYRSSPVEVMHRDSPFSHACLISHSCCTADVIQGQHACEA